MYQIAVKIYQMSIKYTNIFHCKTLKNLLKLRFLPQNEISGLNIYIIWQPCVPSLLTYVISI
jgi:hypothetical protein